MTPAQAWGDTATPSNKASYSTSLRGPPRVLCCKGAPLGVLCGTRYYIVRQLARPMRTRGAMSEISRERAFDRAIDLIMKQNDVVQDWVARLVLIEGGLGIAVGTLLSWKGSDSSPAVFTLIILLASFGMASAVLISLVLDRHQRWQALYVDMVKRVEGNDPLLFQPNFRLRGPSLRLILPLFGALVLIGWAVVIATLVSAHSPLRLDLGAACIAAIIVALLGSLTALVLASLALRRTKAAPKPEQAA